MRRLTTLLGFLFCWWTYMGAQTQNAMFVMPECTGAFPSTLTEALNTPRSAKSYNPMLVSLLKEGRILYGTPMNDYLDNIAEKLMQDHPQLQNQVHFYVLLSPRVNAYALNNGVILVTTGMLAQITNEAELAFVMAHEIAHVYLHHAQQTEKSSRKSSYVTKYLNYHQHSREQELEADRVGLTVFYQNSPYSYEVLDGVYDVLKYSHLPFDELPFLRKEVETDFYHFPDNYFLTNVSPITDRSGITDTLFTHPNVDRRREVAKAMVHGWSDEGRVKYWQDKSRFDEVNRTARLACIDLYLQNHLYDKAYYNAFVLQEVYPGDVYLQKAEVASLYGVAKHKLDGSLNDVIASYRDVEGEMQQVSYLFSKLTRNEWSVLALREAWKAYRQHPKDEYYERVVLDLMKDIFVKEKMQYNDFCDFPQGMLKEDIHLDPTNDTVHYDNKYDRLKNNGNAMVLPDKKFKTVNYMLVDIHRDSLFFAMMNRASADAVNEQIMDAITQPNTVKSSALLIIPPEVRCYAKNKEEKVEASHRQSEHLLKMMTRMAKKYKVETAAAGSMPADKHPNTRQYNDLMKWQRWLHDYANAGAMSMTYLTSDDLEEFMDSLGTHQVCYVGAVQQYHSMSSFNKYMYLILTLTNPIMIPVGIADFCVPIRNTRAQFVVADIVNGKTMVSKSLNTTEASSRVLLDNFVYTQLRNYLAR